MHTYYFSAVASCDQYESFACGCLTPIVVPTVSQSFREPSGLLCAANVREHRARLRARLSNP